MKKKPFDKMTAAEKRVAIARDVIMQLEQGVYEPGKGYSIFNGISVINQKTVKAAKVCEVCAIGAAMVSGIRLGNHVTIDSYYSNCSNTRAALSNWFSHKQIDSMEAAYEQYSYVGTCDDRHFGRQHVYGAPRMTAIFKNIISNKGTFKP